MQQSDARGCLPLVENLYGIDYGSKLAGTTVVASLNESKQVNFWSSTKKQDADAFLLHFFAERPPGLIFLDAPLSLPKVYTDGVADEGSEPDFFYRECDRALGAMSPLFLGGLTARAMRLAYHLTKSGWQIRETYPGALARLLNLQAVGYKKEPLAIADCYQILKAVEPKIFSEADIPSWHHFDALLALCGALRYVLGRAEMLGDPKEGCIVF